MMIRLRLLGPQTLERPDGAPVRSVLAQHKRFALLAYLAAAYPRAPRRRDTVVSLFWPEADTEHARSALRQSLYQLRRSLGREVLTGKGSERVGVDPEALWCDVVACEEALAAGRPEEALELYRGPFLEGFHLSGTPAFERWVTRRREGLRRRAVEAAWQLTERQEGEADAAGARKWAERAVGLAPYDGAGVRRYLALMDRLGQPAAAVRAYRAYRERLAADLDLRPSPETIALVDRIRGGGRGEENVPPEPGADASPRPGGTGGPGSPASGPGPVESDGGADPGSGSVEEASAGAEGATRTHGLRRLARPLLTVVGLLALAALSYAVVGSPGSDGGPGPDEPRIRSLAVLPLDDLSEDPDRAYLADGMTEALIDRLGDIAALRVISRTSAMRYRDTDKPSPRIARELGVDGLVEGSVLRAGDRLRITLRLVHAPSGRRLWSEAYERDFEQILELQEDLARGVAAAVRADVPRDVREGIERRPTATAEAYGYYLRGNDYLRRNSLKDWRTAESMYEKAVELDPAFAKAWERLVYVRGIQVNSRYDTVKRAAAERALERLRALGPDLDETRAAEGWFAYWGALDFDRALREFETLHRRRPRDPEVLWALARVHWWAARHEEALPLLEQLLELDPRNPEVASALATILSDLHRVEEAERYADLALALAPDNHFSYVRKWRILALGTGDTARAARVVQEARGRVRQEELAWLRAIVAEYRRDFAAAIEGFRSWPLPSRTKHMFVMRLAHRTGNTELARIYADSLERLGATRLAGATRLGNVGQMGVARYELARVQIIRGRHEEAVRQGEEALRLVPLDSGAPAPAFARGLVWIYIQAGRHADAVRLLERLLEVPGGETRHSLRLNPIYDGLRGDPGFQALIRTGARDGTERSASR